MSDRPKSRKPRYGNKTLLTPELQEQLCKLLSVGNYIEPSVAFVGIHKQTFYRWLKQGANDKHLDKITAESQFHDAIQKALSEGELRHVNNIAQHAEKSWQASAWMLERKNHKNWGRKETVRSEDADTPSGSSDMTSGENLNGVLADLAEQLENDRWED